MMKIRYLLAGLVISSSTLFISGEERAVEGDLQRQANLAFDYYKRGNELRASKRAADLFFGRSKKLFENLANHPKVSLTHKSIFQTALGCMYSNEDVVEIECDKAKGYFEEALSNDSTEVWAKLYLGKIYLLKDPGSSEYQRGVGYLQEVAADQKNSDLAWQEAQTELKKLGLHD